MEIRLRLYELMDTYWDIRAEVSRDLYVALCHTCLDAALRKTARGCRHGRPQEANQRATEMLTATFGGCVAPLWERLRAKLVH